MVKIDSYETIEELIDGIYITQYEQKHGITQISKKILPELSNDKIKTILVEKSTGEFGLVLGLLVSTQKRGWQKVYPYDDVLKLFPQLYLKYLEIDRKNQKAREEYYKKKNEQNNTN